MVDITAILSSSYKAAGAASAPSHSRYVNVDPKSYQGTWSGVYANKKTFTLTVSQVHGFRAKVGYHSGATVKYQDVLIRDHSFRIGDTKFTLVRPGVAQIRTVVTNPATGGSTLETAKATQS